MAADLEHLHPIFRARVEKACAKTGASILSGARSTVRQAQLFEAFQNGTGNPANPPGSSWHEFGDGLPGCPSAIAVDFLTDDGGPADRALSKVHAMADELHLCFPIKSERWHAQPIEVTAAARIPRIAAIFTRPPTPTLLMEEVTTDMEFTYIVNNEDWLWLGAERVHARCASGEVLEGLKKVNQIVPLGVQGKQFHDFLCGISKNANFSS